MWHFEQKLRYISFLLILVITFSCSNDSETLPETCDSIVPVINISDQELYDTIYSEFKYYQGFYFENLNGGSIYFENTVSVNRASDKIFLCTDDSITALNWSEKSANNSAYYRALVSSSENEKYFEFRRVHATNSNHILLSRVFKCSYLDLSLQAEINTSNWIIGTFNQRPIKEENGTELIEFLNFTSGYQWNGKKFLASETCETNNSVRVVLFETEVIYGDWGLHDQIFLIQSTYNINKSDGLIKKEEQVIRVVAGKLN